MKVLGLIYSEISKITSNVIIGSSIALIFTTVFMIALIMSSLVYKQEK